MRNIKFNFKIHNNKNIFSTFKIVVHIDTKKWYIFEKKIKSEVILYCVL